MVCALHLHISGTRTPSLYQGSLEKGAFSGSYLYKKRTEGRRNTLLDAKKESKSKIQPQHRTEETGVHPFVMPFVLLLKNPLRQSNQLDMDAVICASNFLRCGDGDGVYKFCSMQFCICLPPSLLTQVRSSFPLSLGPCRFGQKEMGKPAN